MISSSDNMRKTVNDLNYTTKIMIMIMMTLVIESLNTLHFFFLNTHSIHNAGKKFLRFMAVQSPVFKLVLIKC